MSIGQYNIFKQLTSVRLTSEVNIPGVYNNGALNNGTDSYLLTASPLVVDGIMVQIGDRIALIDQTITSQNGIYVLTSPGVLSRSKDFQNSSQLAIGQFFSCYAGVTNAGSSLTIIAPLPNAVGVDDINFTSSTIASVNTMDNGSYTATLSGAIPATTLPVTWEKVQDVVTLTFGAVQATATSSSHLVMSPPPANLLPSYNLFTQIPVILDSTISLGKVLVTFNAGISINSDLAAGNFTSGLIAGLGATNSGAKLTIQYTQ